MFRKPLIKWERTVKEFDGLTDGLEKAINYCFNVDADTPYFKIETVYGDSKPEETYFSTLVMQLKFSARSEGTTAERKRLQDKIEITDREINDRVAAQVKNGLRHALQLAADKVAAEIMQEIAEA
jgi:hypothetical protein